MLGYEHTGYIAKDTKSPKETFDYRLLRPKRRARHDYMPGYTDVKRTTVIETADCIRAKEDYVVWLEGESKHRRVIAVDVDHLNDLNDDLYMVLEME